MKDFSEVYFDKCWFCFSESLCWHFKEDNGYTEEAICKECLKKAIDKIEIEEII